MCSNNACDLNCICSFRMSFLFVFVCLYISNCSRAVSYTHLDVYKRQVYGIVVFVFGSEGYVFMYFVYVR